jgi:hypothetical protein
MDFCIIRFGTPVLYFWQTKIEANQQSVIALMVCQIYSTMQTRFGGRLALLLSWSVKAMRGDNAGAGFLLLGQPLQTINPR